MVLAKQDAHGGGVGGRGGGAAKGMLEAGEVVRNTHADKGVDDRCCHAGKLNNGPSFCLLTSVKKQ